MGYENVNFDKETRFLITGGAGFIGSNLCEALLNKGYFVRCLDDFSTGKRENIKEFIANSRFELVEGDIRNFDVCEKACRDIQYVSHQSAWGSVPRSMEMPCFYGEVNIIGTLNMLEAARKSGTVKRFVYASSSSVYGDEVTLPKKEGREGNPISPYALTKKVDELYGKLYAQVYGLETIGFRYFNVFGRRQNPEGEYAAVIPSFIKSVMNDESPTIFGDGEQTRDFTYIENVIEANLKGMVAPQEATGRSYNIACGGRVSINQLLNQVNCLLEKSVKADYRPERAGDVKHGSADIEDAQAFLDYSPSWTFEKGVEETLNWYKVKI